MKMFYSHSFRLSALVIIILAASAVAEVNAQSNKSYAIIRGVHFNGGSVIDSVTKKSQANINIYCISGSDTIIMKSNARGKLPAGDSLKGSPDSISVVSATPGFHVTRYKIKVLEHGSSPDQSGNMNTFYIVEIKVRVSKD